MGSFVHRLASGVRVGWASSTAFASLGTTLTTLLLIPLLDVLFDVLMGHDLSSPNLVRTGYAAALVAVAVSVSGGVVSSVAADRNLGVFHEVHTRRRLDAAYWLSAGVMPLILAIPTGAAAIGSVFVLSSAHDIAMLGRVVALVPVVVVCGLWPPLLTGRRSTTCSATSLTRRPHAGTRTASTGANRAAPCERRSPRGAWIPNGSVATSECCGSPLGWPLARMLGTPVNRNAERFGMTVGAGGASCASRDADRPPPTRCRTGLRGRG